MLKGTIIKIILVVLLAFVLRVLFLDSTPPGLYVDEAAIGYNAYTISHTGRDEHGHILPLFLESYGTFTSGLVVYFVAVQDWSLRITPVILGTLSVLVMIILASKYLKSMRDGIRAGLILALAPSHVLWSRAFYEPTLGLLLFLIGLCRNDWLQMLFLSLSIYAYQPLRLISYIYLFMLVIQKKITLKNLFLFIVTQIPMFYLSLQPGPNSRALTLLWWNIVPHNLFSILREFLSQYLAYLSPSNLFWYPDPDLQRSLPLLSVFSSFWLIRSLYVLLPMERKVAWNTGYRELFLYLNKQNKLAVVDVDKPVYILKLFYDKYIPSNLAFRPLNWKEDLCQDQLIVGTDLLVSENQAREHFLDFKAKFEPNLVVYSTNSLKKCKIR